MNYAAIQAVSPTGTQLAGPVYKRRNREVIMNAKVERKINGLVVRANPVYKGGALPAYWACAINERTIEKTFSSATAVFRFARSIKRH